MIATALGLLLLTTPVLAFDLSIVVSQSPPLPTYKSPTPSDQLLFYLGHVGGNGDAECDVYARSSAHANSNGDSNWLEVGSLCACTISDDASSDEDEFTPEAVTKRAIYAAQSLAQSAMVQRRLIEEQAKYLHPGLRSKVRSDTLDLGIQLNDAIYVVPPSSSSPFDSQIHKMHNFGFVAKSETPGKGLYGDFWKSGGPVEYDRLEIQSTIRRDVSNQDANVVILTTDMCGKTVEAVEKYKAQNARCEVLEFQKMTPVHSELALLTGHSATPYIYKDGDFF
ncbi:hypothetical protein TrVE_jg13777 [Triparma verrucosa]|uniref:Uncharacterized protein n=2 Tax=Triparma TaxID=722752 RepID=A0A9W7EXT4_9STRA|nr:hypothetical protein TrST_g412 [Triparma strigata]GMI01240.1 hypothetical protein TrVE_jg13777 [Triparma verrucosa]